MSTIASTPVNNRNSLVRSIALGGVIIGTLLLIIQNFIISSVLYGYPFTSIMQYDASGALGNAAFSGGLAAALLGVFFHYLTSFVVSGVFVVSAARIPLLRRHAIVGSLLFGFGVFIVMYAIVLPLSAAPKLSVTPTLPQVIELILAHILLAGLPLGILVRRNANADK